MTFLNETRQFELPFPWHELDSETGTRLWKLNLHSMEFLAELDDADFMTVVLDWIESNPIQMRGYWLDSWNSFALSIRCVVWLQQLASREQRLPSDFRARAVGSLIDQLRFLENNLELDLTGNHLIKEIRALVWAGRFFSGSQADRWLQKGLKHLQKEVAEQVLCDGMHYERSPVYHRQVFGDLLDCYRVLPEGDHRARLLEPLSRMAQALVDTTHPDGYASQFNDGSLEMVHPCTTYLSAFETCTGRTIQAGKHVSLRSAGYYGYREDGGLLLVDCGPIGPDFLPGHGHGDVLSFEWSIGGKRMFVDPGVFEYNPGTRRAYARSTAAHNTVTVDGRDQADFWGAFRVGHRPRVECLSYDRSADGFVLEGRHDGFRYLKGAPKHRRRLEASTRKIFITDEVSDGAGQTVEAGFLVHPDCRVQVIERGVEITSGAVRVLLESASPSRIEEAQYYPTIGESQLTSRIVVAYGNAPVRGSVTLTRS